MTTQVPDTDETIPISITRPLKLASYGLLVALVLITIWAAFAPLATTIRANGTLISAKPSYDIQHSYNGRIRKVLVSTQQNVEKHQILFELDVSKQEENHAEITSQIDSLEKENIIIKQFIELDKSPDDPSVTAQRYNEKHKQLLLDVLSAQQSVAANLQQAVSTEMGLSILIQRRKVMLQRSESLNALVGKGILAKIKEEDQSDIILTLDGEINSQKAQLASLHSQVVQAELEEQKLKTQFRVSMLNQFHTNKSRLPELRRQSLALEDEIESATIRSPISGTAVYIGYDTNKMYVERGETLVTLSQALAQPSVELLIPTQAIDQVTIGMIGKLTIPGLPQRNLPQIRVRLKSIAPDAAKDREGNSIGYRAQAAIIEEDLRAVIEDLKGNLHLATDMPVSVALAGRKTTFSQYLLGPFFSMFKGALQD